MHGAAYDKKGSIPASHDVTYLANARCGNFGGRPGQAIYAANFLHGGGRHGEELPADAEENDLFRPNGSGLHWSRRTH